MFLILFKFIKILINFQKLIIHINFNRSQKIETRSYSFHLSIFYIIYIKLQDLKSVIG